MDKLQAITLSNELQYVILSTLNYQDKAFILVSNITDENTTSDQLEIFKASQSEDGLNVETIEDITLYSEVKNIFEEKLKKFAQKAS